MNTTNLSPFKRTVVGVQFLFVAFGATVLVPLLVGLDPATALFTAGIGYFYFRYLSRSSQISITFVSDICRLRIRYHKELQL